MNVEVVPIESIKRNPANYRKHPAAQVSEIRKSLETFGQYRPLVLSSDGFLLAGEGVLDGLIAKGDAVAAIERMPFTAEDPKAKKLIVVDNEVSRMAEDDQTQLAALLASFQQTEGLSGTGWDDSGLDTLIAGLQAADFDASKVPDREFDEDLDLSGIKTATCPECGHEFPL